LELPRPAGTPSSRGRISYILNIQKFTFLLLKRRWIQKLVFEDGGVQNISRIRSCLNFILFNLWLCCKGYKKAPKNNDSGL